jgi:predicted GNAT family acetyltransferase
VSDHPDVVDNPDAERFEIGIDGRIAELTYRRAGDRLVLVHTGVPDELAGHGLGGALVRAAIDHAAREGVIVVPQCPFARRWISEHPDEVRHVTIESPPAGARPR